MAVILWGKPNIKITPVTGTSANLAVPTPVADSTQLTTEAGDKHTADIEGGGYEAVRYDKNTFQLEFSVRHAKDRVLPFADVSVDGAVPGTYSFNVSGEDAGAPVMILNEATVRYEDEFDADGGARRHYFAETIVPEGGGEQITWDQAPVATPSALNFAAAGSTQTVEVTTNAASIPAGNVTISSGASWLTKSVSGKIVSLTAAANTGAARSATVTISDGTGTTTVAVTQAAGN